ncbi:50S ribosomal protein L2 [archaeon]|jgi:large subunit ribosomal protein L2|nr:50S ribosomal protein L2 [archaeon]
MGKRITQQARGKGSLTFRGRPKAYRYKVVYPKLSASGVGKIIKLFNSPVHSAPLVKVKVDKEEFIVPAASGIYEGQEIYVGARPENKVAEVGDILSLNDIAPGTKVFNVEIVPGKGGKILRSSGISGVVMNKDNKGVEIIIKRRKVKINGKSRATVGLAAGEGRLMKPLVKAGKRHHIMKAIGRKWHRTSAVKTNALDHPFGGGRGKRIKSKIAKRNSPPGRKVGHIRPKQTGKRK